MREAGILMPISSLASKYGVGDFGPEAYQFVDLLQDSKCRIWQLLPLNPLGYGNSPYQPYSSIAMDELYISLDMLCARGLLDKPQPFQPLAKTVDYEHVRKHKEQYLKQAYQKFVSSDGSESGYNQFVTQPWVHQFAVFMAFKKANDLRCWNEWPNEQKQWIKHPELDLSAYAEEIQYQMFLQYILFSQWNELKTYANRKGIRIMGDIPFYVGIDSLDVWANQACFLLDDKSHPTFIAGVPPDYFSVTGQRWGNPIYDWSHLKETGFSFWLERLQSNQEIFDIIRIDHFRAFDTYWKIPASCPTAEEGAWIEAPGYEFFDVMKAKLPNIELVVEDLGDLRKEVLELRDHYEFPGMKIVQFAFDPNENNNNFADKENMVIYSGTHDNQTIRGWYHSQAPYQRKKIRAYFKSLGYPKEAIAKQFVRYTLDSVAKMAILPLQDIIGLDDSGRMNTPGTVGSPNWEWKLDRMDRFASQVSWLKEVILASKR